MQDLEAHQPVNPWGVVGFGIDDALLKSLADRFGLEVVPEDQANVVAFAKVERDELYEMISTDRVAYLEVDELDARLEPILDGLQQTKACAVLSITTLSAFELSVANFFRCVLNACGVLMPEKADDVELAVHEAVHNAIVHGNLGVNSTPGDDLEGFSRYHANLMSSLQDSTRARRRLTVTAVWDDQALSIAVEDEGMGYVPESITPRSGSARSGRGLKIIQALVTGMQVDAGGRRIVLRFAR